LKIDRSFTAGIETDSRSRAFVSAIIEMARALGIGATAEGVETEGQLQALRDKGIETVQGYLLGRPMTPHAAASLIADHKEVWGAGDEIGPTAVSWLCVPTREATQTSG